MTITSIQHISTKPCSERRQRELKLPNEEIYLITGWLPKLETFTKITHEGVDYLPTQAHINYDPPVAVEVPLSHKLYENVVRIVPNFGKTKLHLANGLVVDVTNPWQRRHTDMSFTPADSLHFALYAVKCGTGK